MSDLTVDQGDEWSVEIQPDGYRLPFVLKEEAERCIAHLTTALEEAEKRKGDYLDTIFNCLVAAGAPEDVDEAESVCSEAGTKPSHFVKAQFESLRSALEEEKARAEMFDAACVKALNERDEARKERDDYRDRMAHGLDEDTGDFRRYEDLALELSQVNARLQKAEKVIQAAETILAHTPYVTVDQQTLRTAIDEYRATGGKA